MCRVERLLTEHKEGLSRLAEALLQHETLTGDEVKLAVEGSLVKAADTGAWTRQRKGLWSRRPTQVCLTCAKWP